MTSFVSRPWFRNGHCLVIPNRHIVTLAELEDTESAAILAEVGRLAVALDKGYGTGMMQKYQPLQDENGIKVNHLHVHVFPRNESETMLFPVPEPNTFDGFSLPSNTEVGELAQQLR